MKSANTYCEEIHYDKELVMISRSSLLILILVFVNTSQVKAGFISDIKKEYQKSSNYPCLKEYPCFKINNNYPQTLPISESYPWLQFDFQTQPEEYMQAVFDYVIEGNIENDWNVAQNKVRSWYHAPWLHIGASGREPLHGLTKERSSKWHELSKNQKRKVSNWAVAFYNAPGGYVFSQVWQDPSSPDSSKALFPVGTVSAKVLFTDATDEEAPFMKGGASLTWDAKIQREGAPKKLRLLQLDIAVRDSRADEFTGWLFGTFMFYGKNGSDKYWENMIKVGLQWGNDPNFTYADYKLGLRPAEGWVNPLVRKLFSKRQPFGEVGYLGRVNGPVDSPFSSCLGCHSRALDSNGQKQPAFKPELADICVKKVKVNGYSTYTRIDNCSSNEELIKPFFRNLKSREPFIEGAISLDYSLQLALGLVNWHLWFRENYPKQYSQRNRQVID